MADRTAHRDAATSTGYSATTNIRGYQHRPAEALGALDAELAATVERLQRARVEFGLILRNHAPTDLHTDFASAAGAAGLSEADGSLMIVMSRVMGAKRLEAYAEMLRNVPTDPTDGEFDALPADADDEARQGLAERMAPHIRRHQAENRAVAAPDSDAPRGKRFVSEIAAAATREELYTPAQLDVFRRVQAFAAGRTSGGAPGRAGVTSVNP